MKRPRTTTSPADRIQSGRKEKTMTEKGFTRCLQAVLDGESELNESFDPDGVRRVETFEELGVLTRNHGLLVTMDDGAQFQLTVVRCR